MKEIFLTKQELQKHASQREFDQLEKDGKIHPETGNYQVMDTTQIMKMYAMIEKGGTSISADVVYLKNHGLIDIDLNMLRAWKDNNIGMKEVSNWNKLREQYGWPISFLDAGNILKYKTGNDSESSLENFRNQHASYLIPGITYDEFNILHDI